MSLLMRRGSTNLKGYSLLELLIVLAIFVILGSFGTGGLIGFRETMLVADNVETLKQDIALAQQKAMLLERDTGDNWLYGIGLDFSKIDKGEYSMFRWCSPFKDYASGGDFTRSKVLNWDGESKIGNTMFLSPDIEEGVEPVIPVIPTLLKTSIFPQVIKPTFAASNPDFKYGYLPYFATSEQCILGEMDIVYISGEASDKFTNAGDVSILTKYNTENIPLPNVAYVVFEAVTGKAFLYDTDGKPVNYDEHGDYSSDSVLDILITRKRSSKFDLITIYPSSGTIVHHVYSSKDLATVSDTNTITVDERKYKRFTLYNDLHSYRK